MKEWIVDIECSGSYNVVVKAETKEEAEEKAQEEDIEEYLTFSINHIVASEIKGE